MPDEAGIAVSTAYQSFRRAPETVWGTAVTLMTEDFASYDANVAVKYGSQKFTGKGTVLPSVVSSGKEEVGINWEAPGTYEEFGKFITDVVSDVKVTDIPAYTYQCSGRRISGGIVDSWNVNGDPSGVKINGTIFGKDQVADDTTGTPSKVAVTPILNKQVAISIGGSPVTNVFKWGVSVSGLWAPAFYVGSAAPGGVVQRVLDASFNISLEATAANLALLAAGTKAVVITMTGTSPKVITLAFDAALEEPEPFADNDGVYGYGLKYAILNKATTAIDVTVTLA